MCREKPDAAESILSRYCSLQDGQTSARHLCCKQDGNPHFHAVQSFCLQPQHFSPGRIAFLSAYAQVGFSSEWMFGIIRDIFAKYGEFCCRRCSVCSIARRICLSLSEISRTETASPICLGILRGQNIKHRTERSQRKEFTL